MVFTIETTPTAQIVPTADLEGTHQDAHPPEHRAAPDRRADPVEAFAAEPGRHHRLHRNGEPERPQRRQEHQHRGADPIRLGLPGAHPGQRQQHHEAQRLERRTAEIEGPRWLRQQPAARDAEHDVERGEEHDLVE
jgi:hypothetical protein